MSINSGSPIKFIFNSLDYVKEEVELKATTYEFSVSPNLMENYTVIQFSKIVELNQQTIISEIVYPQRLDTKSNL